MAACTSDTTSGSDEQDAFKRSSLCRCPNKQYTVPFWLKVKQLFIGKELKKNTNKSDEIKKVRKTKETFSSSNVSTGRICGIIVLVALFCCSSAACIVMWFTDIYLRQILETMTVHNGSFMFESWRKPSLKPLICVYAFNYTNLDRYLAAEEDRIRVKETGPYCYRETLEKINVKFNEEEGTVTYGNKRSHKFDESHSRGNPNDTLVLPNLGVITAISQVRKEFIFKQMGLTVMLRASDAKVITRVKAHDFFFDYKDKFLKFVTDLKKILQEDTQYKKFGILAIRGAETDDTLTVKTGENDLEHIDVVTAVNGQRKLNIWYGEECNRIDGSDGAFFPRKDINRTTTLYLFHQDICRRLPLIYDRDVDFQDGIMAMRFHMPPSVYDTNGTCYCKKNCPPKGIFDLSRCSKGIPIMMSFPHFLNGDPSLTEHIEGLHPNKSLHDFFIDVQPSLGFSLGMVSRLQVNIQVKKSPAIPYLHGFKDDIILPIVWIEVFADRLPQDLFRVIYHATFTVRNAQLCLMWGTLIATVVTALCILHSLWKIPGRDKHKLPPLPSQSTQMVSMHPQTQQIKQNSNSTVPSTSVCDTNV